jgi:hypothetical protein
MAEDFVVVEVVKAVVAVLKKLLLGHLFPLTNPTPFELEAPPVKAPAALFPLEMLEFTTVP